jgi:methyltransferase-like protein/trans-aconitate methyltransferase
MSNQAATDAIARAYDLMPYASKPFPQSHPARSAAIAHLFGLSAPDVATARVLELGCAAGGNIIPLAARFPAASFVGVDISGVQVAEGQARIEAMGLQNISLSQRSISDVDESDGAFDYIICHGVFSWVPDHVRSDILRVARDNLLENGVAYISYNVFPGWHLRRALRDAMMFHAEQFADPVARVQAGRDFLDKLAATTDANGPYGQLLRQEARLFAAHEDHYIAHEFLELNNDPCHVRDFIANARAVGLEFLSEANLHGTIAETFGATAGKLLRDLSGNQLDRFEQYSDFLSGRTFRQTLLVRQDQLAGLDRMLTPQRMVGLHVSLNPLPPPEFANDQFIFRDNAGRTLTTSDPIVRDSLITLAKQFPKTSTASALCKELMSDGDQAAFEAAVAHVQDALFKMALIGMVEVSAIPVETLNSPEDRPHALAIARFDATSGRSWTTNIRHETVPLNVVQRAILPALDGTNDMPALRRKLDAEVQSGDIRFESKGALLTEADAISDAVAEHLVGALRSLARSGILQNKSSPKKSAVMGRSRIAAARK